jgi:hypothetical protein
MHSTKKLGKSETWFKFLRILMESNNVSDVESKVLSLPAWDSQPVQVLVVGDKKTLRIVLGEGIWADEGRVIADAVEYRDGNQVIVREGERAFRLR